MRGCSLWRRPHPVQLALCVLTCFSGDGAKRFSRREEAPERRDHLFDHDGAAFKIDPFSGSWLVPPGEEPVAEEAVPSGLLQRAGTSHTSQARSATAAESGIPYLHSGMDDFRVAEAADPESKELVQEGLVRVVRVATTYGEVMRFRAKGQACLMAHPLSQCWEKYGSYGFPRLYAESWKSLMFLKFEKSRWMASTEVQGKRLFDVTFPGTRHSGAFQVDSPSTVNGGPRAEGASTGNPALGVITQNLNTYDQLRLGIRAMDIRVAWNTHKSSIFASNGAFTVALSSILADLRKFLDLHTTEVIMLSLGKDTKLSELEGNRYLKPLENEEGSSTKVAGEMVHMEVADHLGAYITTHANLQRLPADENWENPLVSALVNAGVRLVYFWEGQQVLCTTLDECQHTPGWSASAGPFTFGAPMLPGQRQGSGNRSGAARQPATRVVEPACLYTPAAGNPSRGSTAAAEWTELVAGTLRVQALHDRPSCLPEVTNSTLPALSQPPLLYNVHATTDISPAERDSQLQLTNQGKAVFSRGEAYTARSEAERLNYLLLNGLFRQGAQSLFGQPNVISFDYPPPILVHRIIEENQRKKECGYAIYCRASGSCWSQSLSDGDAGSCRDVSDVEHALWWRAEALYVGIAVRFLDWTCWYFMGMYLLGILAFQKCFFYRVLPTRVKRPRKMTLNDWCCPCYFWCFEDPYSTEDVRGSAAEHPVGAPLAESMEGGHPQSADRAGNQPADEAGSQPADEANAASPTAEPGAGARSSTIEGAEVHADIDLGEAGRAKSQRLRAAPSRTLTKTGLDVEADVSERSGPARSSTIEGAEILADLDVAGGAGAKSQRVAAGRQVGFDDEEEHAFDVNVAGGAAGSPRRAAAAQGATLGREEEEEILAEVMVPGAARGAGAQRAALGRQLEKDIVMPEVEMAPAPHVRHQVEADHEIFQAEVEIGSGGRDRSQRAQAAAPVLRRTAQEEADGQGGQEEARGSLASKGEFAF